MYVYDCFQHCCPTMNRYLDPEMPDNGELLKYVPATRSYDFILHENGERSIFSLQLLYCPWCGKKLPERLSHKMEEVLEKEYGITEKDWEAPWWNDEIHLPSEFRSDEWWKKRGL